MYKVMYIKNCKYILRVRKSTSLKWRIDKGIQCDPNYFYNDLKR